MSHPAGQMASPGSEERDPREFLRLLWRRKWILILCLSVIPAATYLYSQRLDETYQTSTLLQVQASAADSSGPVTGDFTAPPASGTYSEVLATLIETSGVADEAARVLRRPEGSLRGAVDAEADEDTGFIQLTASAGSAEEAARIANAFAEAVRITRRRQAIRRVDASIRGVEAQLSEPVGDTVSRQELAQELQRLRALRAAQGQNTQVIEPAVPPSTAVSPNPRRNTVVSVILALLIAAALIAFLERMDRRVREAKDLEKLTGMPLLARVPATAFPGGPPDPRIPVVFETLRDGLTFFNVNDTLSVVVVVSALQGEGKTTVVSNLGVAFARASKRVIVVDADLRKPQLGPRLGVENSPGLSDVLMGADPKSVLQSVEPFEGRLRVLPGGSQTPNPSEMLRSARMAWVLETLAEDCDLLLIDTAPLLVVSDAYGLLDAASGLVGVARLEQTPRDAVKDMVEVAATAGGRLLGMVATGGREDPGYGYGYRYGYGYGYADAKPLRDAAPPPGTTANGHGEAAHVKASLSRRGRRGDRIRDVFRSS